MAASITVSLDGRRVGRGSAVRGDRDDGAGFHVYRVLDFKRQRRASVFQFRDVGFLITRTASWAVFLLRFRSMRGNAAAS
jgi:hypothetical protein